MVQKKKVHFTRVFIVEGEKYFSPKQTEYGDGDGERDEGERVSGRVHGLHVGEIQMGI